VVLRVHVEAEPGELLHRATAELVVAEHREELAAAVQPRDLTRDHRPAPARDREHRLALHDLPGGRHMRDEREVDPLDMTDHRAPHRVIMPISRSRQGRR